MKATLRVFIQLAGWRGMIHLEVAPIIQGRREKADGSEKSRETRLRSETYQS